MPGLKMKQLQRRHSSKKDIKRNREKKRDTGYSVFGRMKRRYTRINEYNAGSSEVTDFLEKQHT